jgi:hypothetical protein
MFLGQQSLRPIGDQRLAWGDVKRVPSRGYTPRQNHLLAALPPDDYERLLPELEPVPLPASWVVYGAGDREK